MFYKCWVVQEDRNSTHGEGVIRIRVVQLFWKWRVAGSLAATTSAMMTIATTKLNWEDEFHAYRAFADRLFKKYSIVGFLQAQVLLRTWSKTSTSIRSNQTPPKTRCCFFVVRLFTPPTCSGIQSTSSFLVFRTSSAEFDKLLSLMLSSVLTPSFHTTKLSSKSFYCPEPNLSIPFRLQEVV
jgi:hypothetical protein